MIPVMAQQKVQEHNSYYNYERNYNQRKDSLIDFYFNNNHWGFLQAAARFYKGRKIDQAISFVDSLVHHSEVDPSGDMFWTYPMVLITYTGDKYIPYDLKKRMHVLWKNYHPYRGNTENHWAMWYTSLYLMSQYYPNEPGSKWFDGRSSEWNMKQAKDYLISWMNLTTARGQGEFNSPTYFPFYVASMSELYAFAKDPEMRMRAKMMIDYLLADFAIDNLYGIDTGAHSRVYPEPILNQYLQRSTEFSWLEFGDNIKSFRGESFILALSGYRLPGIIYHIANDRSRPYIMKEVKRTQYRMRYSKKMIKPVYKYLYMSKDYSLGSLQGGLLQPIQQQTWGLTWSEPKRNIIKATGVKFSYSNVANNAVLWGRTSGEVTKFRYSNLTTPVPDINKVYNNFFTIQPYFGAFELGMYFPEEPKMFVKTVIKAETTYNNPDKWTGGSRYESVFQDHSALIALYDISKDAHIKHIDGHFPKSLTIERDKNGWIFARVANTFIAYYPLAKYKWTEETGGYRLRSNNLQNGAVVQVASSSKFNSFDAFKKAVKALPFSYKLKPVPSVSFTNFAGNKIDFTYKKTPELNGKKVDFKSWKLFDGPFLYADRNSKKLLMKYGNERYLLNFNNLTIKSWIEQGKN